MTFDKWLIDNGFEQESKERYTIRRIYLYELYLSQFSDDTIKPTERKENDKR